MRYVYQTLFGEGGDCFRACVAAILEKPIEDVPHFMAGHKSGQVWTQDEWDVVRAWCEKNGYNITWLDPDEEFSREWIPKLFESDMHYIACVRSVFGGHSVVGHKGDLVFCPNRGDVNTYGEPYLYYVLEELSVIPISSAVKDEKHG